MQRARQARWYQLERHLVKQLHEEAHITANKKYLRELADAIEAVWHFCGQDMMHMIVMTSGIAAEGQRDLCFARIDAAQATLLAPTASTSTYKTSVVMLVPIYKALADSGWIFALHGGGRVGCTFEQDYRWVDYDSKRLEAE